MNDHICRMNDKGQIVIPKDIRDEMGLECGDFFSVRLDKDGSVPEIIIKKGSFKTE